VRARGAELRERFGAHSIGIGRKHVGGKRTDSLALIFYVQHKGDARVPIPITIAFTPSGHGSSVALPTDVVETPPVATDCTNDRE
jgi:hypothetical protein